MHTTHFDDCGCKSTEYEAKIAHLQECLDEAEKLLREARFFHEDVIDCVKDPCKWCQDLAEYRAKIGDTTHVDDGREIQDQEAV